MPGRLKVATATLTCLGTVSAGLLAGCGTTDKPVALPSDSPQASSSHSPSPSANPIGPVVHPAGEKDILGAYSGMLNAYAVAAETNDTAHPGLTAYTKGDARKQIGLTLIGRRGRNVHVEGRPTSNPWVESASPDLSAPTSAKVVDCIDTSNWLQHKADGSVVPGDTGGRRLQTATLDNADGSWKVNALTVGAIGSC